MKLILQTANIVGDEKNCLYPNRAEVTSAEELQEAVKMDHVCAEYDNDYRSKENFRQSNVLVMDCDNDHTENPGKAGRDDAGYQLRHRLQQASHAGEKRQGTPAQVPCVL